MGEKKRKNGRYNRLPGRGLSFKVKQITDREGGTEDPD